MIEEQAIYFRPFDVPAVFLQFVHYLVYIIRLYSENNVHNY